jgi:hypothetical protein
MHGINPGSPGFIILYNRSSHQQHKYCILSVDGDTQQ